MKIEKIEKDIVKEVPKRVIGLDVGTSRIVSAQRINDRFEYKSQLNAFLPLPYSKLTRGVLQKEKIPHTVDAQEMVVYGNESERFANLFSVETRRPMTKGLLNPDEPNSLEILRHIVAALLDSEKADGTKLCFSLPGAPLGSPDDLTYHEGMLRQLLSGFGFSVTSVNEGLAVILADLEDSNYTGIGISCGGGMCNVCLAYLSLPVFSFSVPKAGDFIDGSAASVAGEGPTRIRAIKEELFHLNGTRGDKIQQALAVYYDDMINSVIAGLRETLSKSKNVPRLDRPIPIVVSGGSAMPHGFRDRFEKLLGGVQLPVAISEIRLSTDPLNSTAKGALVAALAEL